MPTTGDVQVAVNLHREIPTRHKNDPVVWRTGPTWVEAYAPYLDAGFDEVYVANLGRRHSEVLRMYGAEVLPRPPSWPAGLMGRGDARPTSAQREE